MRTALDAAGLRRELARRGMTSAELAQIAGLSEATISHGLNHHRVSYTTIRKLARALTVTPVLPNVDAFLLEKTPGTATASSAVAAPVAAPMEVARVAAAQSPS